MRLGGPPATAGLGWALVFTVAAVVLFLPGADAQAACGGEPTPPHCQEPSVTGELPDDVRASFETLAEGESDELSVPVNVTYETAADDETEVTVEPASTAFEPEGGSATVSTGETVQIPIDLVVGPNARAGPRELPLFVNTSATDVHEPTSQQIDAQVSVPWVLLEWHTRLNLSTTVDGFSMELRVFDLRVNGPVDLIVVSENHTPSPPSTRSSRLSSQGSR